MFTPLKLSARHWTAEVLTDGESVVSVPQEVDELVGISLDGLYLLALLGAFTITPQPEVNSTSYPLYYVEFTSAPLYHSDHRPISAGVRRIVEELCSSVPRRHLQHYLAELEHQHR